MAGEPCPLSSQRVGVARQISAAPRKAGVEDSATETTRKGVLCPLSWAQMASAVGRDCGPLRKKRVKGPARKVAKGSVLHLVDRMLKGAMANPGGDDARVGQAERSTRLVAESPLRTEQLETQGIAVVMRA